MRGSVQRSTKVALPAARMWARATTAAGINDELRPLIRMTMPRAVRGLTIDEFPIGRSVGRSWILLFGLVPVDYDELCLVEVEPGRRFLERSRMLMLSEWQHERVIEPVGDMHSRVTDRLEFQPRPALAWIPGSTRIATIAVEFLFGHRHRRLIRRFGDR